MQSLILDARPLEDKLNLNDLGGWDVPHSSTFPLYAALQVREWFEDESSGFGVV